MKKFEINPNVEKFQLSSHDKSETSFFVCTILGILHCFVGKLVFSSSIYAVLLQNRFLQFTRFCVEKNLAKNSARGEKMTNIRYVHEYCDAHIYWVSFGM